MAFAGGALLLKRQRSPVKHRLDIPGVLLVSGAVFCLVYGFSNAATHSWHAPSTYGFLAAGVALGVAFAAWQVRAAYPLLPPRVVLDRNRGGAYLSMLIGTAGMFGTLLFLTYYLQQMLGYSQQIVVPTDPRRRFQFSLKGLMIAVTVAAAVLWLVASIPWPVASGRVRGVQVGLTESQVIEVMGRPHDQSRYGADGRYRWTWSRQTLFGVAVVYFSPNGIVEEAFDD